MKKSGSGEPILVRGDRDMVKNDDRRPGWEM